MKKKTRFTQFFEWRNSVKVVYFMIIFYYFKDTEPARRDIAAQYTTMSRLDQGGYLCNINLPVSLNKLFM